MPEYVAALCHIAGADAPFESANITAANDEEAIAKAVQWKVATVSTAPLDRRIWLLVRRDGKAIHSQEIGRF
jgi:hypothetical protein